MTEFPFQDAVDVCRTVHGDDRFMIQLLSSDDPIPRKHDAFRTTADELANFAGAYDHAKLEVLMMVGFSTKTSRKADYISHTFAVAVDFDHGVPPLLTNPLLRPTITIRTSPGCFHAIWVFERDKVGSTETEALLLSMATRLGGNLTSARVNQMIRLPGFLHGKYGEDVRLMPESNFHRTFQYDWLRRAIEIDPAWTPARQNEHLLSVLERRYELLISIQN